MSDRNHVHFAEHDDYNEPTFQPRPTEQTYYHLRIAPGSIHRNSGSPGERRARFLPNSVRFAPESTTESPRISSPVIRDPTPYNPYTASLDDELRNSGNLGDEGYEVETRPSPPSRLPLSTFNHHYSDEAPDYFSPIHFSQSPIQEEGSFIRSPVRPLNLPTRSSWADHDSVSTSETLSVDKVYDDDKFYQDKKYNGFFRLPSPPSAHLRQDEVTIRSTGSLRPVLKRTPTSVEEGGIRAKRGVFQNLMSLYGLSKRPADPDDLTLSRVTTATPTENTLRARTSHFMDSPISAGGQMEPKPLDPDHPALTGVKSNSRSRKNWEQRNSLGGKIVTYHIASRSLSIYHKIPS
jgi:hypothetical protein